MNLRQDIRELDTGPAALRRFGFAVGGLLLLIGLVLLLRHRAAGPYLALPGALLTAAGLLAPCVLKPVYLAWMTAALVLGFGVAHVLLILLFLLVVTPVGLLARLTGRDFLDRKMDRTSVSYWRRREPAGEDPKRYERQF